jgi:hypothetical protein
LTVAKPAFDAEMQGFLQQLHDSRWLASVTLAGPHQLQGVLRVTRVSCMHQSSGARHFAAVHTMLQDGHQCCLQDSMHAVLSCGERIHTAGAHIQLANVVLDIEACW